MLEVGRDLNFSEEAFRADDRGQLGFQDLEGNLAVMLQVLGQVDRGHAALAELALDGVAPVEGGVEKAHGFGHRAVPRGGSDRDQHPMRLVDGQADLVGSFPTCECSLGT